MTALTMLQLKILRTKKRLSNTTWTLPSIVIALISLMIILSTILRGIAAPSSFGVVESEIPVIPVAAPTVAPSRTQVAVKVPMVILTPEQFYFGTMEAFAENFRKADDKFYVPHNDGAPDLPKLITTLSAWLASDRGPGTKRPDIVVFVPTEDVPMPIVIQCMAALKDSKLFGNVVLGGGLL